MSQGHPSGPRAPSASGHTGRVGTLDGVHRRRLRAPALLAAVALGLPALAACGGEAVAQPPNWQPKPDAPYAAEPNVPNPNGSGPAPSGPPSQGAPSSPGQPSSPGATPTGPDPNVVATKLTAPTGVAVLPDGTALVGERTTGKVVQVQPQPGQPTPVVQTLTGLDVTGDGGLLDLAVAPTYDETGLVYAYVTTAAGNQVVTFTLGGAVTPVVTGIPKGATGNAGRILFDAAGDLVVATGTAGAPVTATSLNGKVLRYDDVGRPASDNPTPNSPVVTTGLTGADGLCVAPTATGSTVNLVGSGATGQVAVALTGRALTGPITTLPTGSSGQGSGGLGGCTVLGNRLYVSSLDAGAVYGADLSPGSGGAALQVGQLDPVVSKTYGRLRTVVADPSGALWITTSNRDGKGKPVADDERVLRIQPAGGGGGGSKA